MPYAVISGCNRGIGAGIARSLLEAGYTVVGLNRTAAPWRHSEYEEKLLDISDAEAVARSFEELPEAPYTVIVNAGIRRFGEVGALRPEDFLQSLHTNLASALYMAHSGLSGLRQHAGYLFVVGSHAEKYPFEGGSAYCSSKGGLRQFVDCFIEENRRFGVRATYLSLGAVRNRLDSDPNEWKLDPKHIGALIVSMLKLPAPILIPYLDARPITPPPAPVTGIERLQYV
jgi:NAD(P)-dependent dehydrogenase (short-subunit alcohol dehydrogenase family)